jgi:hypothetical protein
MGAAAIVHAAGVLLDLLRLVLDYFHLHQTFQVGGNGLFSRDSVQIRNVKGFRPPIGPIDGVILDCHAIRMAQVIDDDFTEVSVKVA